MLDWFSNTLAQISSMYVISFQLLWDSGLQREALTVQKKKKGHKYKVEPLHNYCPCHKVFET